MEFYIISGLSGAGKSQTARIFEDLGFYCVDNMPVVLIPKFAEICLASGGRYERAALVTDVRGGDSFESLFVSLDSLRDMGCNYSIIFVEAAVDIIINRYKESRRRHPLYENGVPVEVSASKEIALLEGVRSRAKYVIDTTGLSVSQLREQISALVSDAPKQRTIGINVISFGFKFGVPIEADLMFDVRFLPNPYYIEELRHRTGLEEDVRSYVFGWTKTHQFLNYLTDMLDFLLPNYIEEGKLSLNIAIGCTGGKHRSVAIANELFQNLERNGYNVVCSHRDISHR